MTTVVEFVGLPGVGKTTLSRSVALELEVPVSEPTRELDDQTTVRRIASKARFATTSLLRRPKAGITEMRVVLAADQQSVSDMIRVLFNLQYVTGVITAYQPTTTICLLDQGPYQGLWSVGFRSTREWDDVLDQFDGRLPRETPDLVVFVEADETTIANRLHERTGGDTRFRPGAATFERGIDGYERLKSQVQATGPQTIVIENETREALRSNATRVANAICSIDG